MREKESFPTFQSLQKRIPCLAYRKRLLFMHPVGQALRGLNFDPSGWSKTAFSLDAFVLPLCVPADDYHMTFGLHLRILAEPWSVDMVDLSGKLERIIREQALPLFDSAGTPLNFVHASPAFLHNPHAWKARAFCVARAGRTRQAIDLIDDYIPRLNLESHWQKDLAETSLAFRDLLASDPEAALRQLVGWEDYTIGKLGLAAYR